MKVKIFDALRSAFFRALSGAIGIGCILGPIVFLNVSESLGWELATGLGFLLILSYAVVLVLCLRAKWDALKELASETTLAMCFMIVGLLTNEITGIFVAIKHKLVIVYAVVGFLTAELIKPTALGNWWGAFKRKQIGAPVAPASGNSRSAPPAASAGLIPQKDKRVQAIATPSTQPTTTQKISGDYETDGSHLLSAECRQPQEKIDNGKGRFDATEIQLEQWQARIQEAVGLSAALQNELAAVKQQLVEREGALEMLRTAAQSAASIKTESQRVRLENQGLQEELTSHRIQLEASESRIQTLVHRNQEIADRYEYLETEVADLNRRLKASQSMEQREIETAGQELANVESRAMLFRMQQKQSEARIVELERELSNVKQQLQAHEGGRRRLRDAERVCQQLAEENRRLRAEFPVWQQRLAAAEESQQQVSSLWHQIHRLQTEHARLINEKRLAREAVSDSGEPRLVGGFDDARVVSRTRYTGSHDSLTRIPLENEENAKANWISWAAIKGQWRFGAVAAAVAMIAMFGVLETKLPASKEVAVAPEISPEENTVNAVVESKKKPAPDISFHDYAVETVSNPRPKSVPRIQGIFETVRPTQVYDGPSENAALIADIGVGMKLNVVGSRYGWLEVRSVHGRPPGFVRQDAAVIIARN